MALRRTKLLGVQSVTGITTVGILTVGVTLDADDVIAVYASDTNLACSVFGVEIE